MSTQTVSVGFPSSQQPFTDPKTGLLSRVWLQFLSRLWNIVGAQTFYNQNTAGPFVLNVPANTGGTITVSATQASVGSSTWQMPYVANASSVSLGATNRTFLGADPISSVSTNALSVDFVLLAASTKIIASIVSNQLP